MIGNRKKKKKLLFDRAGSPALGFFGSGSEPMKKIESQSQN